MSSTEQRAATYSWGQRVIALDDLSNDGSYPERPLDALLVARGSLGEIVKVGHAPDMNEPVYLVQFDDCVIGCMELEIIAAPAGLMLLPQDMK
jgi:nitrogen fixation protein NifZ